MKYNPKEVYHILNCLGELVDLDIFEKAESKALSQMLEILNYFSSCSCKNCRKGKKTLEKWIKIIRDKKNYYRLEKKQYNQMKKYV